MSTAWWFAVSTTAHQLSTFWADCCWWDNWEISTSNDLSLKGHWPIGRFLCQATRHSRDINPLGSFYVKRPVTQGTLTHWEISTSSDLCWRDINILGDFYVKRPVTQGTLNPLGDFCVKWPITQGALGDFCVEWPITQETLTHWEISMSSDPSLKGH